MLTQLPSVPSLIPSSFATRAIGRDVSITIFTASSLNSGEKIFFGRGNYFTFPDGPSYWMDCPEGSGQLSSGWMVAIRLACCRGWLALCGLKPEHMIWSDTFLAAGSPPIFGISGRSQHAALAG